MVSVELTYHFEGKASERAKLLRREESPLTPYALRDDGKSYFFTFREDPHAHAMLSDDEVPGPLEQAAMDALLMKVGCSLAVTKLCETIDELRVIATLATYMTSRAVPTIVTIMQTKDDHLPSFAVIGYNPLYDKSYALGTNAKRYLEWFKAFGKE